MRHSLKSLRRGLEKGRVGGILGVQTIAHIRDLLTGLVNLPATMKLRDCYMQPNSRFCNGTAVCFRLKM